MPDLTILSMNGGRFGFVQAFDAVDHPQLILDIIRTTLPNDIQRRVSNYLRGLNIGKSK